jgi:hypothetical protein
MTTVLIIIGVFWAAVVITAIFYTLIASKLVPGFWTWIRNFNGRGLTTIYAFKDGLMEYRNAKTRPGNMIVNIGKPDEFIDQSTVERTPMSLLHNKRVMFCSSDSYMPQNQEIDADIQRVLDHLDKNHDKYPNIINLQEYEVFECMYEDKQTAREIIQKHCNVETEYLEGNEVKQRDPKMVEVEVKKQVDACMAEIEQLSKDIKYLPKYPVFVDKARVLDATAQRYASQIFKRYKAEILNYVRAQYGGLENSLYKGIVIGLIIGVVGAFIAVKFLGV